MLPYVFILGMAHSGSTLLTFLLNAHPEIATLGEIERLNTYIPDRWARKKDWCSCGNRYFDCEFWNRVLAGFAARGYGFGSPDFFHYRPDQKEIADKKLQALVESVLDVSGKRVFLDASKYARFISPLSQNPHLDLRVLDLYRDGRAIVNSWLKHLSEPGAGNTLGENWREKPLIPLIYTGRITLEWARREKHRQNVLKHIPPNRVHALKYEDLCSQPDEVLRKVFRFLGVEPEVQVTQGFKSLAEHHIIGNQMRLTDKETIRLDEKWRQQLTPGMQSVFNRAGGRTRNRLNGYS